MSHFVNPDLTLTVCLSLCLLCFILGTRTLNSSHSGFKQHRYYFWGMYGFAALATLTKGLIGLLFPSLIILVWISLFNHWRQLKYYCIPSGILLFLVITLPWHLAVQIKNPEFFQFYFIDQHILRYLTDYSQRKQPIWFFPLAVAIGFLPWISFFLASIRLPQRRWLNALKPSWQQRHLHEVTVFFIIWFIVILLFFTLSHSLLFSYALPTLPPLAILLACQLSPYWQEKKTNFTINRGFILITIIGLGLSIAGLIAVYPQSVSYFYKAYWYLSLALLAASSLLSSIAYKLKGFKAGFITLFTGFSLCYISINLSYPTIDHRSIKPLALALQPLLTPTTEVAAYRHYYQDLPVYIGRTVTIVNYQGELAFGMQHQDTNTWMLNEVNFWKHWQNSPQMYMIMNLKDYKIKKHIHPDMYPLAQTPANILVTNKPP
jgi:4-amino-4-deoxy-L-arabinose transferase-like glycosyltransferase